jgi:ketosteroid isomerase-like protein
MKTLPMFEQSSEEIFNLINGLENLLSDWVTADFGLLDSFYCCDAVFVDPITQVNGLSAIQKHFQATQKGLTFCHFTFDSRSFANDAVFLTWMMAFKHPKVNGGALIELEGISRLVLDPASGLIQHHQDYYDLGAMLYEHLPLLGRLIKSLKRRLA